MSHIDVSPELFGQQLRLTVVLAPIGLVGLYSRRGERQAPRAAQMASVPFTLSTVSACAPSEVVAEVSDPIWSNCI